MEKEKNINRAAIVIVVIAVCITGLFLYFTSKQQYRIQAASYSANYATELFNTDKIMNVDIIIPEEDWESLLENAIDKKYINCNVSVNGQLYENVGIRVKGNSSLAAIYNEGLTQRYSFKIEFDHYIKNQTCFGLDKLILNNNYCDATYMKEYLTYDMFAYLGADASLYNFANIYINGRSVGFYLALEGIDENFCIRNFGYENGYLYKPETFSAEKIKSIDSEAMGKILSSMSEESQNCIMQCMMDDIIGEKFDFTKIQINDIFMAMSPKAREEMMVKIVDAIIGDMGDHVYQNEKVELMDKIEHLSDDARKKIAGDVSETIINADFDFDAVDMSHLFDIMSDDSKARVMKNIFSYLATGDLDFTDLDMDSLLKAMSQDSKKVILESVISDISNGNIGMDVLIGNKTKGSDLNYSDDNLNSYSAIWDGAIFKTSAFSERKVVDCLKGVKKRDDIEKYVNIDALLKYIAVHTFVVNLDSMSGSMTHNYYLYLHNDRLNIIPWDYNLAFGGYMASDASMVINFPIDTPYIKGIREDERDFFAGILENDEYRAKYHEYLKELAEGYVNSGHFDNLYNKVRSQINDSVATDQTAFYTYDEYDNACNVLYKTILLRAESVSGQIMGTIPSTNKGQEQNHANLINADEIDIEAMGVMHFSDIVDVFKLEENLGIEIH